MQNEDKDINLEESDNLINQANEKNHNLIEIILINYGFKSNTWKMFFMVFFFMLKVSIHLTYFGNLIIPFKNYYNLTDIEISFHSSILTFGLLIGSTSLGFVSYYIKRTNIIIYGQLIILLLHINIALIGNLLIFSILRFLIGFLFGMITPIILNIFTEYLPIFNRGFIMVFVPTGYNLGKLLMPLLMLWLMPNMEKESYLKINMVSTSFSFLSFLLTLLFLRDSPRNLIIMNNIDEGISICEELNMKPLKEEVKELIIHQVKSGINNNLNSSFRDIFNSDYFKSSITLSFIQFSNILIISGTYLVYSLTIKESGINSITNNEIIFKQIFVNLINLFSYFFGGILCENSYLGRLKAMIICSLLGIITIILSITYSDYFAIFIGIFYFIYGSCPNLTITYVSELYPTKIRDLTLGYIFSLGHTGEIISQLVFIYLHNAGRWVPYYTSIGFIVLNILLINSLPIETYNRSLDLVIKENVKNDDENKNI